MYRLTIQYSLLFLFTLMTACAEFDALTPKIPPNSNEWHQIGNDRRYSILIAAQSLINTHQLVDKSMNRLDMEKLKRDYTEITDLDNALRDELASSITVGVNPAEKYPGIRRKMREIHIRVELLDTYLKNVSVVPWKGILTSNRADKYYEVLPPSIHRIWREWQLKLDVEREKTKRDLSNAALPSFDLLSREFWNSH